MTDLKGSLVVHESVYKEDKRKNRKNKEDDEFKISIHSPSRAIFISRPLMSHFKLMAGDRVGFVEHPTNPYLNFMYFTSNKNKTNEIKIYKNSSYRIYDQDMIEKLIKKFRFANPSVTQRLYVNLAMPIPFIIDGIQETLYLLYDQPDRRGDLTPYQKIQYKEELANALKNINQ